MPGPPPVKGDGDGVREGREDRGGVAVDPNQICFILWLLQCANHDGRWISCSPLTFDLRMQRTQLSCGESSTQSARASFAVTTR